MKLLLRRVRGLLGLGAIGGVAGALVGAVAWLLTGSGPFGLFPLSFHVWLFGLIGAGTAGTFAVFLSGTSRGHDLERISFRGVGGLGGLAGVTIPLLLGVVQNGGIPLTLEMFTGVLAYGLVSAGAAMGLLAIAKRAAPAESLPPGRPDRQLRP